MSNIVVTPGTAEYMDFFSANPFAFNVTISGSDRYLIIDIGGAGESWATGFFSGVTCDGVAMTLLEVIERAVPPNAVAYKYGLAAPHTGTVAISVTRVGPAFNGYVVPTLLTNVSALSDSDSFQTDIGSSSAGFENAISTPAGGVAVDFVSGIPDVTGVSLRNSGTIMQNISWWGGIELASYKADATLMGWDATSASGYFITAITRATFTPVGAVLVAPQAPTIGTLVAGDAQVAVYFTAPTNTGSSAINFYTATMSTGETATGASSPIIVAVTNGVATKAKVKATNLDALTSSDSAFSNTVTPTAVTRRRIGAAFNDGFNL